jgi:hypothetical protein
MTKLQSSLDAAVEMVRDLEEFKRSGSKEAFRKQLGEEYVRRLGAVFRSCCFSMDYLMHILHAKRGTEIAPKTKHRIVTWDTADDVTELVDELKRP